MARRILVVDDDESIRTVVQMALELVGNWQVEVADSGERCLEMLAAELPEAILLDVMMPAMDGLAVVQCLQANERTRHIPVVLLTAKVQASDRQRYKELGVAGLLEKPFDPLQLPQHISQILGWST